MRSTRRRRAKRNFGAGAAAWTITFCDLLTLLLSAFVLRFSMSTFDIESFKPHPKKQESALSEIPPGIQLLQQLTTELQVALGDPLPTTEPSLSVEFPGEVVLEAKPNGVLIALRGGNFLSGSDEPSSTALEALAKLSSVFTRLELEVEIAGHTDSNPIQSDRFPSNWELSTARAVAVAEQIMHDGVSGAKISAVGYADTRPRGDNITDEGRYQNRRVELYVRGDKLQPNSSVPST